jgi:hypothetical protein
VVVVNDRRQRRRHADLDEAARDLVERSCAEQGLPVHFSDDQLRQIAGLVRRHRTDPVVRTPRDPDHGRPDMEAA